MAITAKNYFDSLHNYINKKYIVVNINYGKIRLEENYGLVAGKKPLIRTVNLKYRGDAFTVKLDGEDDPLFHFLKDKGHPWSKRCDFVIFHRSGQKINVYCIEFKSNFLNYAKFNAQLEASVAWCASLNRIIRSYTQERKKINIQKFVFSSNLNPGKFLSLDGKYIQQNPSIRFYHYGDVEGIALEDLENSCVNTG